MAHRPRPPRRAPRRTRLALAAALLITLGSGFATTRTVEVRGRALAGDGTPLRVMVVARNIDKRITTAVTTDPAGGYRLDSLLPGWYRFSAVSDEAEVAVRDSVQVSHSAVVDLRATGPVTERPASSAEILGRLPEGEEKRRFILDCTGCHQMDQRVAGGSTPRSVDQWDEAITRMLRYAGATTGFPVISAHREPRPTAEWLARHLATDGPAARPAVPAPTAARTRSDGPPPRNARTAVITEYELPVPHDLPHDVAVLHDGRLVITGMMTHQLYLLDPASGTITTKRIPVERANPRAIEIDGRGDWWVLLGAPHQVARYQPDSDQWTMWKIGMYPHSVALDSAGGAWFNGHFTRAPELIGHIGPDTGAARIVELPLHPTMARQPGGPIPYELRLAPDGRVWTSELQGNRIIAHTPGTSNFEVFEMPLSHSGPRRFDIDRRGLLWIPAYSANALVRLDPATRKFTSYPLPVPDAVPYVARVDSRTGRVWVGNAAADVVLAFDPATRRWEAFPLPSRGALVRHLAIDSRSGAVWLAYGASPGIAARVARVVVR